MLKALTRNVRKRTLDRPKATIGVRLAGVLSWQRDRAGIATAQGRAS
jgi:hypothetical protein